MLANEITENPTANAHVKEGHMISGHVIEKDTEEDIPYVFDRFYKSDKSRGLDKSGVGLGMYISRTIMEAHGEKISVRSKQGEFCEFTLTLGKDRS